MSTPPPPQAFDAVTYAKHRRDEVLRQINKWNELYKSPKDAQVFKRSNQLERDLKAAHDLLDRLKNTIVSHQTDWYRCWSGAGDAFNCFAELECQRANIHLAIEQSLGPAGSAQHASLCLDGVCIVLRIGIASGLFLSPSKPWTGHATAKDWEMQIDNGTQRCSNLLEKVRSTIESETQEAIKQPVTDASIRMASLRKVGSMIRAASLSPLLKTLRALRSHVALLHSSEPLLAAAAELLEFRTRLDALEGLMGSDVRHVGPRPVDLDVADQPLWSEVAHLCRTETGRHLRIIRSMFCQNGKMYHQLESRTGHLMNPKGRRYGLHVAAHEKLHEAIHHCEVGSQAMRDAINHLKHAMSNLEDHQAYTRWAPGNEHYEQWLYVGQGCEQFNDQLAILTAKLNVLDRADTWRSEEATRMAYRQFRRDMHALFDGERFAAARSQLCVALWVGGHAGHDTSNRDNALVALRTLFEHAAIAMEDAVGAIDGMSPYVLLDGQSGSRDRLQLLRNDMHPRRDSTIILSWLGALEPRKMMAHYKIQPFAPPSTLPWREERSQNSNIPGIASAIPPAGSSFMPANSRHAGNMSSPGSPSVRSPPQRGPATGTSGCKT